MGEMLKWIWSKLAFWRKISPPRPPTPSVYTLSVYREVVGAEFLETYHEKFQQMQSQFFGYIRDNPEGAAFFKNLSIEDVADMTGEIMRANLGLLAPKYEDNSLTTSMSRAWAKDI